VKRLVSVTIVLAALILLPAASAVATPASSAYLWSSDFTPVASAGFGDAQNSYAWCMAEFNGDVYVGTGRLADTFNPMWEQIWAALSPSAPPHFPDVPYVPFLQDFLAVNAPFYEVTDPAVWAEWNEASRAEIWRYHDGQWTRVYQAQMRPSLLTTPQHNGYPYQAAEATGFRSMIVYTDKNGQSALYASSGGINFVAPAASTLLYRSTDGVNWTRLATPAAMGRETRALGVHNGKLYAGAGGTVAGQNITGLWSSDNPSDKNSWTKVLDLAALDGSNTSALSIASFNGRVYVGTENAEHGFQVWCSTVANPTGSQDWVKVMGNGGGDGYNAWAGTMKVFKNQLYVGSVSLPFLGPYQGFKGCEIFRIDTRNRWQLVVGDRTAALPAPGVTTRRVVGNMGAGFGNSFNFYCWSFEVYRGYLYAGTFDASVLLRYIKDYPGPLPAGIPQIPQLLISISQLTAGADIWRTSTGTFWTPLTRTGFGDAENYGMRNLKAFSSGLWVATSNPFEGCQLWRSVR
jgi:hypothetical protein